MPPIDEIISAVLKKVTEWVFNVFFLCAGLWLMLWIMKNLVILVKSIGGI